MRYKGVMHGTKPHRDPDAGRLLKELRHERYISRRDLPFEMARAGIPRDRIPSIRTIYNVEEGGQIPREYIRFALAKFYDRPVGEIWPIKTRAMAGAR